jgi:5,10-methylenetetrahydromethanopterin reductase
MSTRFHLGFPSPSLADVEARDWTDIGALAEELEFDCLWHSNERFYREMFVRMTVSTLATSEIGIGGAISDPFAVHPAITAQSLATVQELSGGRATLALGAGGSGFPMMGIQRRKPVTALREAYDVITRLVAGETVSLDGEVITARGARLHFVPPTPPPVWIATRGDRALALAGEVASGVFIATYAQPDGVQEALDLVARGAARGGRSLDDVRVMSRVDTCVHPDRERAYAASRLMVAKLLWTSYPDRGFVDRVGLTVPDELERVIATRDYDALEAVDHLVPDEFVDMFCWSGEPDQVAERVTAIIRRTGIAEIGFWVLRTPDQSLADAVRLVAEQVVPAVRDAAAATA